MKNFPSPIENVMVDTNDPRLNEMLAQRQQNGHARAELTYIRSDGTTFPGEVSSSLYHDRDGKILAVAVIRDITERKQAQDRLRASEERLLNQTKELETIIGIVSHDLRAPLVNVKGFNNFIKQDLENIKKLLANIYIPVQIEQQLKPIFEQSIPEATGFIESSADSMHTLVKSLVEVARVGLAVVKPECLDMNELVLRIMANLEIKFKQAGARICLDNLPPCWADKIQATQIFSNLIDNAVKYLDPSRPGEICLGGQVDKNRVIYCISDNGIGIAPGDQEKIFEIFTRLAEQAHAGGEGMGLTMVKRLVDRNNGHIWLHSEKGKGSSFFVSLPAPEFC